MGKQMETTSTALLHKHLHSLPTAINLHHIEKSLHKYTSLPPAGGSNPPKTTFMAAATTKDKKKDLRTTHRHREATNSTTISTCPQSIPNVLTSNPSDNTKQSNNTKP
ncbi:hypothetical protein AAHC03_010201 [Spirometra sp. Aus1]